MSNLIYKEKIEKWCMFEAEFKGPEEGNPFTDHMVTGIFSGEREQVTVHGFYDGNGNYKVRFMPSFEGVYTFAVTGDFLTRNKELCGTFEVTPAGKDNHGPVGVKNTFHFAYADGTPYYSIGTTCYVWELQTDELIKETLSTLKDSAFNKLRFCIFPKHYDYNLKEPRSYPYEGTPMDSSILTSENYMQYHAESTGNSFDFYQFNPEHFRHIEACIEELLKLGIEADLILMHPYDRWGFSRMGREADDLYLHYAASRFSAYRNIWWSLANEYDILKNKTEEDWERYAEIICHDDPYGHLRSIHNCVPFYDYSRSWITHCSIQRQDIYKTAEYTDEWRKKYQKPVVLDEIAYEGDIEYGWGNITGGEMVRRFWEAIVRGGYPGHGETYMNPEGILWWSHGGKLRGESHKRFQFLLSVVKDVPGCGLTLYEKCSWDEVCAVPEESIHDGNAAKEYFLYYYSFMRPSFREFYFDDITEYEAEVLDTWEMTVRKAGIFKGRFQINLPRKQYMAVRLRKVK